MNIHYYYKSAFLLNFMDLVGVKVIPKLPVFHMVMFSFVEKFINIQEIAFRVKLDSYKYCQGEFESRADVGGFFLHYSNSTV